MNEKWTPGPWRVSGVEVIIPDGPFNSCAYAGTKPNANLISAAPDLVDSIDPDTLDAIADEIGEEFKHTARAASLRGIAKRQRAALAKARGEA